MMNWMSKYVTSTDAEDIYSFNQLIHITCVSDVVIHVLLMCRFYYKVYYNAEVCPLLSFALSLLISLQKSTCNEMATRVLPSFQQDSLGAQVVFMPSDLSEQ